MISVLIGEKYHKRGKEELETRRDKVRLEETCGSVKMKPEIWQDRRERERVRGREAGGVVRPRIMPGGRWRGGKIGGFASKVKMKQEIARDSSKRSERLFMRRRLECGLRNPQTIRSGR